MLIDEAGGDPWRVDASVQRGRPAQIADLAQAFHEAGDCTTETEIQFHQARDRFEASWNRENGEHPINDAAEVQRAATSISFQVVALPKIAVDLENIAASLAEAQRIAGALVEVLETQLQVIDKLIGQAMANHDDTAALENDAVTATSGILRQLEAIRDDYSAKLQRSLTALRAEDGYDPEIIQGLDADGQPAIEEQNQSAVDTYDSDRRAQDQALFDAPDAMTPEKEAAAARLLDYAIATDPAADADSRRLASERLDDFNKAQFVGPLPVDPILGGDARSLAQFRQEWQKKFQRGLPGMPPMTPDQATQLLDDCEQQARVTVMHNAQGALEAAGLSPVGADQVLKNVASGADMVGTGVQRYGDSVPTGQHAQNGLSKADAALVSKFGGGVAAAANVAQLAIAINDYQLGGDNKNAELGGAVGSVGGSLVGSIAAGAAVGSFGGPVTAAAGAVIGGVMGGFAGGYVGGGIGGLLDPQLTASGGKAW